MPHERRQNLHKSILWAYGEWNSLGRENQTEGFWVYPSPRWDAPVGQARFEPDRLISIGLTNTPRIETSEPLANSQLDTNTETPTLMDPKLIREKLGLAPETTDEEVFAKIESLTQVATAWWGIGSGGAGDFPHRLQGP